MEKVDHDDDDDDDDDGDGDDDDDDDDFVNKINPAMGCLPKADFK